MVKFLHTCWLLCWVVSVGLLGCGGDDDPLEDFVGSWELIQIDGKTPEADFQGDGDFGVVSDASMKLVFASDGSLYQEASVSFSATEPIDTEIPGLKVELAMEIQLKMTVKGNYVVSGSTLEIISGDQVNADVSASVVYDVDTNGIPELEALEQELNEEARALEKEFERSVEQEFKEGFGLDLTTYTWHLENDLLTLTNGDQEVYRKK